MFGHFDGLYLERVPAVGATSRLTLVESGPAGQRHVFAGLQVALDPFGSPVLGWFDDAAGLPGRPASARVCIARAVDGDGDAVPDAVEARLGTDPGAADSDGDGRSDGDELLVDGTDPLVAGCVVVGLDDGCDGVDDDCDGVVDEGAGARASACGVGACAAVGVVRCVGGGRGWMTAWGGWRGRRGVMAWTRTAMARWMRGWWRRWRVRGCARWGRAAVRGGAWVHECPAPVAVVDGCDGVDDDCDGAVDEDAGAQGSVCGVGCARRSGWCGAWVGGRGWMGAWQGLPWMGTRGVMGWTGTVMGRWMRVRGGRGGVWLGVCAAVGVTRCEGGGWWRGVWPGRRWMGMRGVMAWTGTAMGRWMRGSWGRGWGVGRGVCQAVG
ncbi:MAG: hypothetical protein H6705_16465 [Myxococcales bacterium]|nr:hypothetical protein [Myxococcales bacterium]